MRAKRASNAGDVALTARDLGIAPDQVDVCARYYTAFPAEVDALTAELERAETVERELRERQHAIFS